MNGTIRGLMEEAGERGSLPITIRIHDGDRYAGLDVDLEAMAAVLFCGAVAEEVILFADALYEDRFPHYGFNALRQMAAAVLANGWTWVDCYEHGEELAGAFRGIIGMRERGVGIAASDVLRLELIGFDRENPSVLKIMATGTAAAVMLLASCFGAVHVIRETGAEACRAEAHETARLGMETLERMARLQGRWTGEHAESQKQITAAMNAAIGACGSTLKSFTIRPAKAGGIELEVSGDELRHNPVRLPDVKRP